MDGLTFLRRLREMPRYSDTPVILCTALANREIVRVAASLGVRNYLLKSEYTMQSLLERIGQCLPTPSVSDSTTIAPPIHLPNTPAA